MKPLITIEGLKKIALITVLGAVAVGIFKHYVPDTYDHQASENYAAAERHIPILKARLQGDQRFTNITIYATTSARGSLMIQGTVNSEQDLEDFEAIVKSSNPPVSVHVFVVPLPPPGDPGTPK